MIRDVGVRFEVTAPDLAAIEEQALAHLLSLGVARSTAESALAAGEAVVTPATYSTDGAIRLWRAAITVVV